MANLREIRDRISSVKSTQQITRAMKLVAAAKLKKAQDKIVAFRPYALKYREMVTHLSEDESIDHPYYKPPEKVDRILIVVVGSDRGLCGAFNANLFKDVEKFVLDHKLGKDGIDFITIGRKSTDYFQRREYNIIEQHPGFFDKLSYESGMEIAKKATDLFEDGTYGKIYLAFNEFKSVIFQNRLINEVLPIEKPEKKLGDEDNKYSSLYIVEPNPQEILNTIMPEYVVVQFWRAILESNASEQGARMAAMDNATENAQELVRQLTLSYNQVRQAAITTEISEIVSGAEALSG